MSALPRSAAAAQGVDPGAVRALVEAWEAGEVRPFALTVVRHGHVVVDATWAPYAPDDQVQKYSVSKTFTAAAVGLAVADGRLALDAPVASYFPDVADVGPRAAAMTVEHLLTMTTGHTTEPQADLDDVVGSFLRTEPQAEPGTVFAYDNAATVMLSALVQQVTGETLHDYLQPRLFDPLGIGEPGWLTLGPYDQGCSGLLTTTQAVARLGQTLLRRGEYAGAQVLPADWVDAMMTVHTATDGSDDESGTGHQPDSALGYGYQMWRSAHGWRGTGAAGQLCLVLPDHDLVLAACAQTADTQPMLDAVWEHLLPGVGDLAPADVATRGNPVVTAPDGPPTDGADDLTAFFADRALPTVASTAPPDRDRHQLRAVGPAASTVAASGHVVVRDGTVVIEDEVGGVLVRLGDGRWERTSTTLPDDSTVQTAGTGGWTAPRVLEARIVPLCSPHVLEVRADVAAGTADLRWQVEPLGTLTLTRWL